MTNSEDVREFLVSRRAKVTPEKAGLPAYGGNRRVPGLRREEVAMLAGVSVDYYNRLERGNLAGASESVLDSVATALQLDDAEREHLFDLARAAQVGTRLVRRRPAQPRVRESMQHLLDSMVDAAAWIRNGRMDVLAANALAVALHSEAYEHPQRPMNTSRYLFLDPRSRTFFADWEKAANDNVALLRTELGRAPHDRALSDLVGELSTQSEEFRVRWARHDVRLHYAGTKTFVHPVVGELQVAYNAFDIPSDPGLTLTAYTAQPGSASADKLRLLASWAASRENATIQE